MPDDTSARPTVYYDGACPLCRREIGFYRGRNEDAAEWVDVSRDAPGAELSKEDALARFHVRRADGSLVSGAEGFFELWRAMPGWRHLARLSAVPGVLPVTERAYRGFLRVRPRVSAWLKRREAA